MISWINGFNSNNLITRLRNCMLKSLKTLLLFNSWVQLWAKIITANWWFNDISSHRLFTLHVSWISCILLSSSYSSVIACDCNILVWISSSELSVWSDTFSISSMRDSLTLKDFKQFSVNVSASWTPFNSDRIYVLIFNIASWI